MWCRCVVYITQASAALQAERYWYGREFMATSRTGTGTWDSFLPNPGKAPEVAALFSFAKTDARHTTLEFRHLVTKRDVVIALEMLGPQFAFLAEK